SVNGFMQFRATMLDASKYQAITQKIASSSLEGKDAQVKKQFEASVVQLLTVFAQGGYNQIAKVIEQSVPEKEREAAAGAYIKIIRVAAYEAYNMSLLENKKPALVNNALSEALIRDSLNSFSDMFFYGTPYFLQLVQFEHKQASGLQLTKSPGQKWVYLGSVLLVLGIFAMMYIRERRIWLLLQPDANQVLFAMSSNRKNLDFDQEFNVYREQLSNVLT
ncbi:MAG: cytochrome c biogenesis protein ResB, partial [Methylotenera sp.]|nr:cytochrome c biogenesis protein ResB [Methylotenera sp.]